VSDFENLDHYELLGISRAATPEEIKRAYRQEMSKYHPDRFANASPQQQEYASRRSQRITEAYGVLSDMTARAAYNRGQSPRRVPARRPAPAPAQPRDHQAELYEQAQRHLEADRLLQAIGALRQLQKINPFYRDGAELLAAAEVALARLGARAERHDRWLDALAALAQTFMHEPGPDAVHEALDVLIRQTRAVDAAVATYVSGRLAVRRSRRGVLEARTLTVSAHPDLGRALRDAEGLWLDATAAHMIGLPPDLPASGVPIAVAGEVLGLLLLVFDEVEPHDDDNRRMLVAVSAAMGFALLRDRLVAELRAATPA